MVGVNSLVFVFRKGSELKFIGEDSAEVKSILDAGFVHVATIDPCVFLRMTYEHIQLKLTDSKRRLTEEDDVLLGKYLAYGGLALLFEFKND